MWWLQSSPQGIDKRRTRARGRILALLLAATPLAAAPPSLPAGLGGEPAEEERPSGSGGPSLPAGLGGDAAAAGTDAPAKAPGPGDRWEDFLEALPVEGFVEGRLGRRTQDDPEESPTTLQEIRLQTARSGRWADLSYRFSADWIAGKGSPNRSLDLRRGEGWLDLREAWVTVRPLPSVDLRAGRMINTWGTGDLLFLNDLFPKDWRSFLLGRDVEYLKAPNDGVRVSWFSDWVNLETVVTPRFQPDRFVNGEEISFYNPLAGRITGRNDPLSADIPNDPEVALRAYRILGAAEYALYGYVGRWKSPGGSEPDGTALFPRLQVWGASVRGPLAGGISNAEIAWYDSREDAGGGNPLVNNSELRFLLGHDRELVPKLTAGVQAYLETLLQYDSYRNSLPPGMPARHEYRQVYTLRLTRLLLEDDLSLGGMIFYSPSDEDAFLRLLAGYTATDHWRFDLGANLFAGTHDSTFYGQFEKNSSVYAAMRYSY